MSSSPDEIYNALFEYCFKVFGPDDLVTRKIYNENKFSLKVTQNLISLLNKSFSEINYQSFHIKCCIVYYSIEIFLYKIQREFDFFDVTENLLNSEFSNIEQLRVLMGTIGTLICDESFLNQSTREKYFELYFQIKKVWSIFFTIKLLRSNNNSVEYIKNKLIKSYLIKKLLNFEQGKKLINSSIKCLNEVYLNFNILNKHIVEYFKEFHLRYLKVIEIKLNEFNIELKNLAVNKNTIIEELIKNINSLKVPKDQYHCILISFIKKYKLNSQDNMISLFDLIDKKKKENDLIKENNDLNKSFQDVDYFTDFLNKKNDFNLVLNEPKKKSPALLYQNEIVLNENGCLENSTREIESETPKISNSLVPYDYFKKLEESNFFNNNTDLLIYSSDDELFVSPIEHSYLETMNAFDKNETDLSPAKNCTESFFLENINSEKSLIDNSIALNSSTTITINSVNSNIVNSNIFNLNNIDLNELNLNTQNSNTQNSNTQISNTQLSNTQNSNTQIINTQLSNTQISNKSNTDENLEILSNKSLNMLKDDNTRSYLRKNNRFVYVNDGAIPTTSTNEESFRKPKTTKRKIEKVSKIKKKSKIDSFNIKEFKVNLNFSHDIKYKGKWLAMYN